MYSWGKDLSTRDPVCALIMYLSFFLVGPTGPWHPHGVANNDWHFRPPTWQPEGKGDHSGLSAYQRAGMFASLPGVSLRTYIHYVDDWIIYTSYSKPSCQGFGFFFSLYCSCLEFKLSFMSIQITRRKHRRELWRITVALENRERMP